MLNEQQFNLFGQIQTSQTGGQPCSEYLSLGLHPWSPFVEVDEGLFQPNC